MEEKEIEYNYIMNFSKIKIKDICEDLNIDVHNLYNKKTKKENYKLVREEIDSRYKKINEVKYDQEKYKTL